MKLAVVLDNERGEGLSKKLARLRKGNVSLTKCIEREEKSSDLLKPFHRSFLISTIRMQHLGALTMPTQRLIKVYVSI